MGWCLLGHLCLLCGFWLVIHQSDCCTYILEVLQVPPRLAPYLGGGGGGMSWGTHQSWRSTNGPLPPETKSTHTHWPDKMIILSPPALRSDEKRKLYTWWLVGTNQTSHISFVDAQLTASCVTKGRVQQTLNPVTTTRHLSYFWPLQSRHKRHTKHVAMMGSLTTLKNASLSYADDNTQPPLSVSPS